jgi:hypothetical protein
VSHVRGSRRRREKRVEIRDGWVLIPVPKALLVLSKDEFIRGLRRGKQWRRRQALRARVRGTPAAMGA